MGYLPIIGLEVHVELATASKMFCGCSVKHFLVTPNTHTCPVCLGLPGALPVPNKKAIDWCLMLGIALNCKISKESRFDRKNYFYPDLPKGYQISQYDSPFCRNGCLKLKAKSEKRKATAKSLKLKKIRINRVHMEEDTAKLLHVARGTWPIESHKSSATRYTLIDFNRSGVPLVEIVSEPEIYSSGEAVLYLKKLQQIIRYLGISEADMEKGSMRCEANVSLAKLKAKSSKLKATAQNLKLPDYKVEIKNLNSFRFTKRAIEYEIERQRKILRSGKMPIQETRGFDEKTGKTYSQRWKEEAQDYRYFPEPDIPPFIKLKAKSSKLKAKLPELPDEKLARFVEQYDITEYNAGILTTDRKTADYFEEAVSVGKKHNLDPLKIANVIVNKKVNIKKYLPAKLIRLLVSKKQTQISDQEELEKVVEKILKENLKAVEDYKKGKKEAIGFLVGQVMKETKGQAEPKLAQKLLLAKLR